jgi:hypothetical protein
MVITLPARGLPEAAREEGAVRKEGEAVGEVPAGAGEPDCLRTGAAEPVEAAPPQATMDAMDATITAAAHIARLPMPPVPPRRLPGDYA